MSPVKRDMVSVHTNHISLQEREPVRPELALPGALPVTGSLSPWERAGVRGGWQLRDASSA